MEAFLVIYVGLVIWVIVICVQKGKPGMAWLGLLTGWTVIIGAIRIAKPDSTWAQKNYPPGSVKWQLARNRFPQAMPPHESPPPVAPLLQQVPPTQPAVWLPTHQIPEGGLKARERPDPVLPGHPGRRDRRLQSSTSRRGHQWRTGSALIPPSG
jgi:hypothetical protein